MTDPAPDAGEQARRFIETVQDSPVEASIAALVGASVADPAGRVKVIEAILQKIREDVEHQVTEATWMLKRESAQVERDQLQSESLLANMAEGVVVIDDQGKILMMNPAAEELYGASLLEVAGKPLAEAARDEHLLSLIQEGAAPPAEGQFTPAADVASPDEFLKTRRGSTAVVRNEAGQTVGFVSVAPDVSKQKELARAEREFIAHVTHELVAPLSAIRASLEILQAQFLGKLGSEAEKMIGTAVRNADRLNELIRDILDFGKVESGKMTMHRAPADARAIGRDAVESLQPWAQKKSIQLSLKAPEGLPQVYADPRRIVQVLVNLLSNAIKMTPKGGKVVVKLERMTDNGAECVRFAVQDTGPGIAKADQEKIFQKFVQIAAGEKHVGGIGLGLAIANSFVQFHKGRLWVESDEGHGATFLFTLPLYVPSELVAGAVSQAPAPRSWWQRFLGA